MRAAQGQDVIVVAGGIGLAPLRPVIYQVLHNREEYGRLVMLYGARSPRDLLYRKELASWARQPETQVLITVDYGGHWLARARRRGHHAVQVRAPAAGAFGRHDLRAGNHDALCDP